MKLKILLCLLVFLLALQVGAAPPKGKQYKGSMSATVDNMTAIDVNQIYMFVTNHGNFGRDLAGVFGYDYGTWYPYNGIPEDIDNNVNGAGDMSPNYASGIWIGGQVNGEIRVAISEYESEYVPGPMANGTFQTDVPEFKVYKLYADSQKNNPNDAYNDYMADAVGLGAPTIIDDDGDLAPDMIGDQMLWSVYNDADPNQHNSQLSDELGIEVKQTVFGFNRTDPLGEIVFIRYRVYNNGPNTIDSFYISLWSDPDLGQSTDDMVGCDSINGIGFVYNADNNDNQYGSKPPCMGFDFLQGPLVPKTDPSQPDGKMWGQTYSDSTNLGMVSFAKYINGTDPDDFTETYLYMKGWDAKAVAPYTYNGVVTTYQHAGNPVKGTGDLDKAPADKRWMQTTGPLTFEPGDSTEILAAVVMGRGGDRKSSISVMIYNDVFAQGAYDNDFDVASPPASPVVTTAELDQAITLSWTDTSEVDEGDYAFQGYTVYQGEATEGGLEWTIVKNYDVIDGDAIILDQVLNPLTGALEIRGVKFGSDNGVNHSIAITEDFIMGGNLNNLTDYFFKVEAYSLSTDPDAVPRTLTSSSPLLKLTPNMPLAGDNLNSDLLEGMPVVHQAGGSQGVITAVIIDPSVVTGDTYEVVFEDTIGIIIDTIVDLEDISDTTFKSTDIAWHLDNSTTGERLLAYQTNQSGDDDYFVIDGILWKVAGPPEGFLSFDVVANGAGVLDPPEAGAFGFRSFPTPPGSNDDGNPSDNQQVGDGAWGFATADNGGTSGGGNRGQYSVFLERTFRGDKDRIARLGAYDWEMRFTGSNSNPGVAGGYGVEAFTSGMAYWVPFELWRIGIGTPDDPSDDLRLIPWVIGDGGDSLYYLSAYGSDADGTCGPGGCEHSASGADNDPHTDWVYWKIPADASGNELSGGYQVFEDASIADPTMAAWEYNELAVMDRTVLVNWNGGDLPPFNQDLPEVGTVFRLLTAKPNASTDVFVISTAAFAPTASALESDLDAIKAVPNPFYMIGGFDPSPGSYAIKFHHLPETCTIKIYSLDGMLIRVIEKNDATTNIASWDVLNDHGLPIASGIYIYIVEAPGFGNKVGKMAVFVEQEVLKIY